jgi:hypothetical protein
MLPCPSGLLHALRQSISPFARTDPATIAGTNPYPRSTLSSLFYLSANSQLLPIPCRTTLSVCEVQHGDDLCLRQELSNTGLKSVGAAPRKKHNLRLQNAEQILGVTRETPFEHPGRMSVAAGGTPRYVRECSIFKSQAQICTVKPLKTPSAPTLRVSLKVLGNCPESSPAFGKRSNQSPCIFVSGIILSALSGTGIDYQDQNARSCGPIGPPDPARLSNVDSRSLE